MRVLALTVGVLGFAYAGLIAWYTLGIDAWRGHTLYAPLTWVRPKDSTPMRRLVLSLLLCLAAPALAQNSSSSLQGDVRPVPDPTLLTTQQLLREMAALRAILEARLDGMDRAMVILQKNTDHLPAEINEKVASLQALHAERLRAIEAQFVNFKASLDATAQVTKEAFNERERLASLAIGKSEATSTKQIDQILLVLATQEKATTDKILATKERLDRLEGQGSGISLSWVVLLGIVSLAGLVVTIFFAVRPMQVLSAHRQA